MKNKQANGDVVRSPKSKHANGQESASEKIMSSNMTLERYQNAYRDMIIRRERKAFTIHTIAYTIGNSILIAINLIFVSQFLWFAFPLVGWSTGLMIHYYLGVKTAARHIRRDEICAENIVSEGLVA
jgi:hypothetical protein